MKPAPTTAAGTPSASCAPASNADTAVENFVPLTLR
jgi:hypothetical protein